MGYNSENKTNVPDSVNNSAINNNYGYITTPLTTLSNYNDKYVNLLFKTDFDGSLDSSVSDKHKKSNFISEKKYLYDKNDITDTGWTEKFLTSPKTTSSMKYFPFYEKNINYKKKIKKRKNSKDKQKYKNKRKHLKKRSKRDLIKKRKFRNNYKDFDSFEIKKINAIKPRKFRRYYDDLSDLYSADWSSDESFETTLNSRPLKKRKTKATPWTENPLFASK